MRVHQGLIVTSWVRFRNVDSELFETIDEIVDGGDGIYNGNFRRHNDGTRGYFYLAFQKSIN